MSLSRTGINYPVFNPAFVGRRKELLELHKLLLGGESGMANIAAIHGFGGFGKTELAIAFGHTFSWQYQLGRYFVCAENINSVFSALLQTGIDRINGINLDSVQNEEAKLDLLFQGLAEKAADNREKNINSHCKDSNRGTKALLILDNVEKPDLIKQKVLERIPNDIQVFITTRMAPTEYIRLNALPLGKLSQTESQELLLDLRPIIRKSNRTTLTPVAFGNGAFFGERFPLPFRPDYQQSTPNAVVSNENRSPQRQTRLFP